MSLRAAQLLVQRFHAEMGQTIGKGAPELRDKFLRVALIAEEASELCDAIDAGKMVEAVDGLADLIYVCLGSAVAWGVDLSEVFDLVHAANMRKRGGGKNEAGKVVKPEGWQAPDVEGALRRQGWRP